MLYKSQEQNIISTLFPFLMQPRLINFLFLRKMMSILSIQGFSTIFVSASFFHQAIRCQGIVLSISFAKLKRLPDLQYHGNQPYIFLI
jgi:hypothetical protein